MTVGNGDGHGEMNGTRLHGRAFYESLGSPKFILAPMVDQSEFVSDLPAFWIMDGLTHLIGVENAESFFHDT